MDRQLEYSQAKLREIKRAQKAAEAVATAMEFTKVFAPHMLGGGKKKVGTKEHKNNRFDVLERVRRDSELKPNKQANGNSSKSHGMQSWRMSITRLGQNYLWGGYRKSLTMS